MLKEELQEKAGQEGVSLKVLEKEALQIYILSELFSLPESKPLTFQGGTCLRLIYGGARYSEDLDFITLADKEITEKLVWKLGDSFPRLEPLFDGKLIIKKQKATPKFNRFRIHCQKESQHESFFVSLEFAHYPAYTHEILPLRPPAALPGLPLTLVRAEKPEELLADKLCAIAGRPFCKGRDYFDLWLLTQKGIPLDAALLKKKLKDYSVAPANLARGLKLADAKLIQAEMEKFLPLKYRRQFAADNYAGLLKTGKELINAARKAL
jgi:predicted nucleotidyltransferase component of viral defense system